MPVGPGRKGLNRDVVVAAAVRLVEEGGPDALTMRKLGAVLGVEAMSLYTYFPTKRDLELAMADRLLNGIVATYTEDPVADAVAFMNSIRERLVAYPQTTRLFAFRMNFRDGVANQRLSLDGLSILSRVDPDATVVLQRARTLFSFVLGHVLVEIAARTPGASEADRDATDKVFAAGVRALLVAGAANSHHDPEPRRNDRRRR